VQETHNDDVDQAGHDHGHGAPVLTEQSRDSNKDAGKKRGMERMSPKNTSGMQCGVSTRKSHSKQPPHGAQHVQPPTPVRSSFIPSATIPILASAHPRRARSLRTSQ